MLHVILSLAEIAILG